MEDPEGPVSCAGDTTRGGDGLLVDGGMVVA